MSEFAILFDSGGVLVLPDGEVIASCAETFGIAVAPSTAVRAMALADREIDLSPGQSGNDFPRAWAGYVGCSPAAAEKLWWHLANRVPSTVLWSRRNDEAVRLFADLPSHVRLYVVSNADGNAHAELVDHGLAHYVEGLLDSGVVGVAKPDNRIFEMASVALSIPLNRCLYVGDTIGGVGVGGPKTVLYDRFDVFADLTCVPYPRIRSLTELTALFADPAWVERTFA